LALSWSTNAVYFIFIIAGLRLLLSALAVSLFFVGFLSVMIIYDCIHYFCHFGPQTEILWLKTLRINHLKHHYRNQQKNFGVTTNLWDKVFGTYDTETKKID
jgi:sterol desaturase/sphingolipid hydroxylase (fatty acid hydroxylase superfamily)